MTLFHLRGGCYTYTMPGQRKAPRKAAATPGSTKKSAGKKRAVEPELEDGYGYTFMGSDDDEQQKRQRGGAADEEDEAEAAAAREAAETAEEKRLRLGEHLKLNPCPIVCLLPGPAAWLPLLAVQSAVEWLLSRWPNTPLLLYPMLHRCTESRLDTPKPCTHQAPPSSLVTSVG